MILQGALAKERRDQKLQAQREQESQNQRSRMLSTAKMNDPMADISQHLSDGPGSSQRQRVNFFACFSLKSAKLLLEVYVLCH